MKHVDPDADHAPFLLLSIRAEGEAADDEYRAVLRFGGLDERGLHRIRLTHRDLGPIDLAEWSGIILGGGPYNVSDPPESKSPTQQRVESELTALIGRVVHRDFPFLGCCYGVGTLGSVVGATIDRTHSEPVGGVTVRLTPAGRADPLFTDVPEIFDAYGGHKEAATALPARAVNLASSVDCPVQAFRVGDNVYATQFPPRTGSRRHLHPHRRLQEPRLLRSGYRGVAEVLCAPTECRVSTTDLAAIRRAVYATAVTSGPGNGGAQSFSPPGDATRVAECVLGEGVGIRWRGYRRNR